MSALVGHFPQPNTLLILFIIIKPLLLLFVLRKPTIKDGLAKFNFALDLVYFWLYSREKSRAQKELAKRPSLFLFRLVHLQVIWKGGNVKDLTFENALTN